MTRLLLLLALDALAMPMHALAQAHPAKPVRVMVPFPPRQAADCPRPMSSSCLKAEGAKWGEVARIAKVRLD